MGHPVPHWQRAVVAIGAITDPAGPGPTLMGSGFIIDAEAGILATCAHVIEDVEATPGFACIVVGLGSPIQWRFRAVVRQRSPGQQHNGLDLALLQLKANMEGAPLVGPLLGLAGPLEALPLGDSSLLQAGEPIVVLGYGQPESARTQTATNTLGFFSAVYEDPSTGWWLRTDSLVLAGHSGGPALDRHGRVMGWNVRSPMDVVTGGVGWVPSGLDELRPVNSMLGEVEALLAALELTEPSVRRGTR